MLTDFYEPEDTEVELDDVACTATVRGLTPGVHYRFTVTARNRSKWGVRSAPSVPAVTSDDAGDVAGAGGMDGGDGASASVTTADAADASAAAAASAVASLTGGTTDDASASRDARAPSMVDVEL